MAAGESGFSEEGVPFEAAGVVVEEGEDFCCGAGHRLGDGGGGHFGMDGRFGEVEGLGEPRIARIFWAWSRNGPRPTQF